MFSPGFLHGFGLSGPLLPLMHPGACSCSRPACQHLHLQSLSWEIPQLPWLSCCSGVAMLDNALGGCFWCFSSYYSDMQLIFSSMQYECKQFRSSTSCYLCTLTHIPETCCLLFLHPDVCDREGDALTALDVLVSTTGLLRRALWIPPSVGSITGPCKAHCRVCMARLFLTGSQSGVESYKGCLWLCSKCSYGKN